MRVCCFVVLILFVSYECILVCYCFENESGNGFDTTDSYVPWPDESQEDPIFTGVQHAALPSGVKISPLPLEGSDHQLTFNVTWDLPTGPAVQDYSLEVRSETNTRDCRTNLCYESNIPGDSLWSVIPAFNSRVAESCAVKPGCAYWVKLIAHPWDGHTSANLHIELDECVAGVCSCAHAPRLPVPRVSAKIISVHGDLFVNITWTLPEPSEPLRLPPRLMKQNYIVSIGKMLSNAHPMFVHIISRQVEALGFVVVPDNPQWWLVPITERNVVRSGERSVDRNLENAPTRDIKLDVKIIARVSLIDERGCVGPAGNATAYDPTDVPNTPVGAFAMWAVFGGACVLVMVAVLAFSARAVKRVLNEFRSSPVSAPLQPLRPRLNRLPLDA